MLMAAARLNIPAVVVSGGPMLAGRYEGRDVSVSTSFEAAGLFEAGKLTGEELEVMEQANCPGCGSCAGLFTANSMNCMTEALGMGLAGNGTIPGCIHRSPPATGETGWSAGHGFAAKNIRPRDILTMAAFENAIAVDMGIGGSSNTVLHLTAIAYEAGLNCPCRCLIKSRPKLHTWTVK